MTGQSESIIGESPTLERRLIRLEERLSYIEKKMLLQETGQIDYDYEETLPEESKTTKELEEYEATLKKRSEQILTGFNTLFQPLTGK